MVLEETQDIIPVGMITAKETMGTPMEIREGSEENRAKQIPIMEALETSLAQAIKSLEAVTNLRVIEAVLETKAKDKATLRKEALEAEVAAKEELEIMVIEPKNWRNHTRTTVPDSDREVLETKINKNKQKSIQTNRLFFVGVRFLFFFLMLNLLNIKN